MPSIEYQNLYVRRWVSIFIINKIQNAFDIDRKKFFTLVHFTSNFIPPHLQRIENIDLSNSKIIGDEIGANSYLSNAKLSNSTLHGNFDGTKFIGTDLTGSTFESYSNFNGVDFNGAILTKLKSSYDHNESEFAVRFTNCDFREPKFIDANISNFNFIGSDFYESDFSGAQLDSNFLACELGHVIISEKLARQDSSYLDGTGKMLILSLLTKRKN